MSKLQEIVKHRGAWHAAVHGVSKSWTWLSDWTITTKYLLIDSCTCQAIAFPIHLIRLFRTRVSNFWKNQTEKKEKYFNFTHRCKLPNCCKSWVVWGRGLFYILKTKIRSQQWISLVVKWLTNGLPMQETRVWSLVQEDFTCCRASKPMHQTTEPVCCNCWSPCALSRALQQETKLHWNACALRLESSPTPCDYRKSRGSNKDQHSEKQINKEARNMRDKSQDYDHIQQFI